MKKKYIFSFSITAFLLVAFIIFTVIVATVDRASIGPNDTIVGLSTLNSKVFNSLGTSKVWSRMTDALAIFAICVAGIFAVYGLTQWIKVKKIKNLDYKIWLLGLFYILVAIVYVIFQLIVINYRPTMFDEVPEVSYPSTHTMVVISIMGTSMVILPHIIKNKPILYSLDTLAMLVMYFMAMGRLLAGVHWLTDILGGIILGSFMIMLYYSVVQYIEYRKYIKSNIKNI